MDISQTAGMLCGLVVGIVIALILLKLTKNNGRMKCEYDERQELIRGRGYKYSFFTLLYYMIIYGLLTMAEVSIPADNFVVIMIGVFLSVIVQVIYCCFREAYVSLNENPKRLIIVFSLIAAINIGFGIMNIMHGAVVVNGILTFRCVNLLAGVMCIIVIAVVLFRYRCTEGEEKEDE